MLIVQTQNINWLFRSNNTIRDTIVSIAEAVGNDEICSTGYGILSEALTDEQMKYLKIADNICSYCFHMLENTWYPSSKKLRKIPMTYLLRGMSQISFQNSIMTLFLLIAQLMRLVTYLIC
jgi:hypothetical protein